MKSVTNPLLVSLLLVACGPGSPGEPGSPSAADVPPADSIFDTRADTPDAGHDREAENDATENTADEIPSDSTPIEDAGTNDSDGSVLDLPDESDRSPEVETDESSASDLEDTRLETTVRDDPEIPRDSARDVALLEQGFLCSTNSECETGLCTRVLEGTASVCSSNCSSSASCGDPGEWQCLLREGKPLCVARCSDGGVCESGTCVAGSLVGAGGVDVCAVPTEAPCATAADCSEGLECVHVLGYDEMFTVCRESGDKLPTGAECEGLGGSACASGVCRSGRCAGSCHDDDDCPGEMVCGAALGAFTLPGGPEQAHPGDL